MIATTMFVGIGYVLSLSMRASASSHTTVVTNAASNVDLRESTESLRDELRGARPDSITVQRIGGNDQLTFTTAIQGPAGSTTWGAFDRRIDVDEDACHRDGWLVRYEVAVDADGGVNLHRRILDATGAQQLDETLLSDVERFTVTDDGEVWVIEVVTEGPEGRRQDEFDVRTRTQ